MSEKERMRMMCRDTLEPVREIAREIFPDYDDLDPVRDTHLIFELCQRANRIKYERLGPLPESARPTAKQPRFPHLVGKGIMYGTSKQTTQK